MRTIKFRGKCAQDSRYSGEWVYGACVQCEKSDDVLIIYAINDQNSCSYHVDPDTVGQFTGLLDKNGKEIYEGDIVEATSIRYGYKDFMKKMLCEIVYNNDFCCFDFLASDRQRFICTSIADVEIEVIGNIHDNPELMKGGEK